MAQHYSSQKNYLCKIPPPLHHHTQSVIRRYQVRPHDGLTVRTMSKRWSYIGNMVGKLSPIVSHHHRHLLTRGDKKLLPLWNKHIQKDPLTPQKWSMAKGRFRVKGLATEEARGYMPMDNYCEKGNIITIVCWWLRWFDSGYKLLQKVGAMVISKIVKANHKIWFSVTNIFL